MKKLLLSILLMSTLAVPGFAREPAAATSTDSVTSASPVKVGALLQNWFVWDSAANLHTFRIRRAEVTLNGSLNDRTRWFLMVDPAKTIVTGTDGKILQDIGTGYSLNDDFEVVVGQYKIPTGRESLDSSKDLILPERSLQARTWGSIRETGIKLVYSKDIFKLSTMVFNGSGTNTTDPKNGKDIAVRLDAAINDTMSAGAFTHAKDMTYRRAGRWGGDFRLDMNHYFARFEGTLAHDSGANSEAGTLDLGYNCPTTFFQPVVRIDYFETTAITTWAHTVGLGYLFNNNGNKIQLAYTHLNNGGGGLGSYVQQPDTKQSLLVLNFQAAI